MRLIFLYSYDSALYQTIAANEYTVHLIRENSLDTTTQELSEVKEAIRSDGIRQNRIEDLHRNDCIEIYTQTFQSSRADVWLLFDPSINQDTAANDNVTTLTIDPCEKCNETQIQNITDGLWEVDNRQVNSCLSKINEERCKIYFNLYIASIIIAMNMVKVAVFTFVDIGMRNDAPLMNIGDAITSFMKRPDIATKSMCLVSRANFEQKERPWPNHVKTRFFDAEPKRWSSAVGMKQRTVIVML